jgi:hypothetical protein
LSSRLATAAEPGTKSGHKQQSVYNTKNLVLKEPNQIVDHYIG